MTATAHARRIDAPDDFVPSRVRIGRFTRYVEAKRAVDRLRVARIPDRRITVLGRGMRWNPRLSAERSARLGGALGATVAAATALLLWSLGALTAGFSWLSAVLAGGVVGGALGVIAGIVVWRLSRDRGAVPETGSVHVSAFDVLVEEADAPKARELLGTSGASGLRAVGTRASQRRRTRRTRVFAPE